MVRVGYYLECAVEQVPFYLAQVIPARYGATANDCTMEAVAPSVVRISFAVDNMRPLVLSLPLTERVSKLLTLTEEEEQVANSITTAFTEATTTSYICPDTPRMIISPALLSVLVRRLARAGIIDRFVAVHARSYVIARTSNPKYEVVVLTVRNQELDIAVLNTADISFFDIDEGYCGILSPLNVHWRAWKAVSNLLGPIHPPNRV